MIAATAQNGGRVEFFLRPSLCRVSAQFGVACVTRKPLPAAFELDRNDVAFAVIMSAPRFRINVHAGDGDAGNALPI